VFIGSCKKSDLPIDESFTDCENCTYVYQEEGNRIIFSYKKGRQELQFNVPWGSTGFDYGKDEIISDKVTYYQAGCPVCRLIPLTPVDGKIVGKKITNTKWLAEAEVFLEGRPTLDTRDTITFKQYFTKVYGLTLH